MWTQTRVCERVGLRFPLVQGPFGGGYSSVALAAAVSEAGGLGSFGAVGVEPGAIGPLVQEIAARTRRSFAINLWVPIPGQDDAPVSAEDWDRAADALRPFYRQLGVEVPARPASFAPDFFAQAEALLEARPPAWSVVMGVPPRRLLDAARARGICVLGTATTVAEARALDEAGVDIIVASGSDAGGHRGSFLRPVESSLVGTMALIPQVARAVSAPVVAAGGIVDGHGIAAALALGAEGVQLGTAFLAAEESAAPEVHKSLLGTEGARVTRLTAGFSGRTARGVENPLLDALATVSARLGYPAQNALTQPLRRAAAAQGRADLLALWAGQGAALARRLPAADLVQRLAEETDQVLAAPRLQPRPR